jgi:ABC-type nitrate/sulfonate/bicarbonate transport system substrate-binding protein
MSDLINRRTALKGLAGTGVMSVGPLGLLASACAPKKQEGLPVTIVSSQGPQVLAIQALIAAKGWFQEAGLQAKVISVASGTNVVGSLVGGTADICIFAGFSQLLAAIEKGAALKILGGASIKGQQALFSKNPDVQYVKDLEGHTVGTGAVGAQLHQAVTALLRKKGVDISKVRFVTIGSSGDTFRAVVSGTVDAGNGQADVLSSLERLGVHMIKDGDYATELPEYTWQASFSTLNAIRDKREALVRSLAAYCKAFRYVQNPGSKDDYVKAYLVANSGRDAEQSTADAVSQWNYLQERKIYAEDLVLSPERVQYMQELNMELGIQKKILPYEQVVDVSLAQEAVALLAKSGS